MKPTSTVGRSLHVVVLALCGLSFYVLVLVLLCMIVGFMLSRSTHAEDLPKAAAPLAGSLYASAPPTTACADIRGLLPTQIAPCHGSAP